ncbi:MAG: M15 family metallopeptidase [Propionibacterium sp.]|nr:M15 family metallopeptidase [Propionibacterium sp.]
MSSLTAQRLVDGQWVGFGSTTPDSTGYFTIVAPNATSVGLHTYRIGFEGVWSDPVTLNRIPGVTAAGAGTKPVGEVTYVWGTAHGAPNRPVFTEVLVAGRWSRSQVGTTDSRGSYTLKLTYGATQAGTYTYRVGVDSAAGRYYSPTFTLRRTAAWSATIRNTVASDVRHTYRAGCPVGPGQLSTITMTYRNYSGTVRTGVLVVRRDIAGITRDAFKEAFDGGFRIGQMTNPDHWQADDVAMMAANNTSAFNCRHVVGNPYRMSPHSTGRAVDINPAQNPYRAPDGRWYPTATYATSRPTSVTGLLHTNSPMVKAMTRRGFQWFSGWDWHHFER